MSPKKQDYGPGLLPAILLAIATFFVGMVLGTASMISREVVTLNRNANTEDLEPGTVYQIRGERLRAAGWEAKEQAIMSGLSGSLALSESDLNQWSLRRLRIEAATTSTEEAGWMDKLDVTAAPPDFRIVDDKLLVAVQLNMPGIFGNRDFLYQVKGDLNVDGGALSFTPEEGTLGCAPLGRIPGINDLLFGSVLSLFKTTEPGQWLPGALPQINAAQIAKGELILSRN